MINHARTLLLNQPGGSSSDPSYFGEELVPSEYTPIVIPANLQPILSILFGAAPDRSMLNYRLRQYLTILHSTELSQFIYDLDPRVTYWPNNNAQIFNSELNNVSVTTANTSAILTVLTNNQPITDANVLQRKWRITQQTNTTVHIETILPSLGATDSNLIITNGLSNAIPLPNSPFSFQIQQTQSNMSNLLLENGSYLLLENGDLILLENAGIAQWIVTIYAKPTYNLSDVVNALETNQLITSGAFFGNIGAEPNKTFNNLWTQNKQFPYKLGGLLLSLIYQLNTIYMHS